MMDDEKVLMIILALTIAFSIFCVVAYVQEGYKHRDCVCLERSLHFNGKIWFSTCSKWEHHHKEFE